MAIIEELGLQATVVINNEAAPEYPDEEQSVPEEFGPATKKSHSYVRSVAGAEFAIRFDVTSSSSEVKKWLADEDHAILISVYVDGENFRTGHSLSRERQTSTVTGVTDVANGLLRKFCFSAISTVDDTSKSRVARDVKLTKHLGEICVRAWRIAFKGPTKSSVRVQRYTLGGSIAEEALKGKAISHGTTLAPAVPVATKQQKGFEWKDLKAAPLAVFYFKYRSTDDLQKEMIIPRPRVASPEAENDEDNDFSNLSKEEIERLARERYAELNKRRASTGIKRESEDSVAQPERSYKYARTTNGKKAINFTQEDGVK